MNLNGFINHKYRHREKNDLYTLIAISNQTVPVQLNAEGIPEQNPKFRVDAFYRKEETGELFSRPYVDFDSKFAICFEDLEKVLTADFLAVKEEDKKACVLKARTWKVNILGIARSLYTIFPMISEEVRINMLRALHLSSFLAQGTEQAVALKVLGERHGALAIQLIDLNGTLDEAKHERMVNISEDLLGTDTIALLMLGVASGHRELSFDSMRSIGYISEEHRVELIRQFTDRRKAFYIGLDWFSSMKITVAKPTLPEEPNLFSEEEAAEVLGNKA